MKLSILIPSLSYRFEKLMKLISNLSKQRLDENEIIIIIDGGEKTIGEKRNILLEASSGEYICFVDDDDEVADDYVDRIMKGIKTKADHIAVGGIMTTNGQEPHEFKSSKDYVWHEEDGVYYRGVQHLGAVKRELALRVKFPKISFGEDRVYSENITPLIRTEYQIKKPIYFYHYKNSK